MGAIAGLALPAAGIARPGQQILSLIPPELAERLCGEPAAPGRSLEERAGAGAEGARVRARKDAA